MEVAVSFYFDFSFIILPLVPGDEGMTVGFCDVTNRKLCWNCISHGFSELYLCGSQSFL